MKTTEGKGIKEIVEDIMQCGFDIAMGGDMFKSEQENAKIQADKYNKTVEKYSKIIKLLTTPPTTKYEK